MPIESNLDKTTLGKTLVAGADAVLARVTELNELDAKYGDGDHGITMNKVALSIKEAVTSWRNESAKEFFEKLGFKIMGLSGGSAASLWGTLLGGLGEALPEHAEIISPAMFKAMLKTSLRELQDLSTAKAGYKTMLDAYIPAVTAAQTAPNNITDILNAAAKASLEGAKATETMVAKVGRAKNSGEKTLGTQDPGAVGVAIFFGGMAQ